jgi:hypothetical protein
MVLPMVVAVMATAGLAGCSSGSSSLTVTITGKGSSAAQDIACTPNGLSVHVTGDFTNQSGHRQVVLVAAKIRNSESDIVGFHGQSLGIMANGQSKPVSFTVDARQTPDSCSFGWTDLPVPAGY